MSAALALCMSPPPVPRLAPSSRRMLTKHEICQRLGVTARTFERKVKAPGVIFVEPKTGRNGKPVKEYVISSLPPELRHKLEPPPAAYQQGPHATTLLPLFADTTPAAPLAPPRLNLSPEATQQALARYEAIQPLLDFSDGNRAKYQALRLQDGASIQTVVQLAHYVAETKTVEGKRVSVRTLFDWLGRYREAGLPALARKQREDKGTSHFFTRYPAAATLAKSVFLRPGTVARAYKAILRDQRQLQIPATELPSYATVRNYLDTLPEPEKILARQGQRRWNETCAPHLTRAYTDVAAGAIYTADHMIHDVEVRNDCFSSVDQDAPMRLRFTCVMDLRTRKIVGYCWTVDGDSRSIATALRRAVDRFGVPELFYCDNGSDFKKLGKGAEKVGGSKDDATDIRKAQTWLEGLGALQMLGIKLQLCLPYHPQSKNIERAFRTLHLGLDAIFHTYLTGNAYNRPDAAVLAGLEHRKLVKQGRGAESSLMPASLFIKLAETWIEQDYNARHAHSGKGMDGRTPNEVWAAETATAPRRKADALVLASLLYERRKALVQRTAVTVNKQRYVPNPQNSSDTANLYQANGRTVIVAFDPNDADFAVAYSDDGLRLAELQAERLAAHPLAPTEESSSQIAAMSQTRGRLLKSSAITIQTMHREVALAGHKSDLQHLADRALANLPVDELLSQRATTPKPDEPATSKQTHAEDIGSRLAAMKRRNHGIQHRA